MPMSPQRPAIVGAAQRVQKSDDPRAAASPIELMELALRDAALDAGAPKLLEALDAIYVPRGIWKYGDPGRILAERVGSPGAKTGMGSVSGHIVQVMVDRACLDIAAGKADVVAIVGGESENSRRRLAKREIALHWNEDVPGEPDLRFGGERPPMVKQELRAGLLKPSIIFALADTSLRHARGESPAEHRVRISELASSMSAVAAKNPYAWIDRHIPADEIRTPTSDNRLVSYPYTKLMTSNIAVDQSAALIVCSAEAARRFGVADDRAVHLRAATEMSYVTFLSHRQWLHRHEGMEIAAERVLELARTDAAGLAHVDLYSCFPFAVQAGAAALGLDAGRPLTVTGGLTFSGGPFGNYVIQAKAAMVERLRADPGSLGIVGSVGGAFAKFGFAVYSTDPGERPGPVVEDVSAEYEALPKRTSPETFEGAATLESYCVDVLADGSATATFCGLAAGGERVWAKSGDPDLTAALIADEDVCGREADFRDGSLALR
jgi:acetyl-CoA C-acetyltransferase